MAGEIYKWLLLLMVSIFTLMMVFATTHPQNLWPPHKTGDTGHVENEENSRPKEQSGNHEADQKRGETIEDVSER